MRLDVVDKEMNVYVTEGMATQWLITGTLLKVSGLASFSWWFVTTPYLIVAAIVVLFVLAEVLHKKIKEKEAERSKEEREFMEEFRKKYYSDQTKLKGEDFEKYFEMISKEFPDEEEGERNEFKQ